MNLLLVRTSDLPDKHTELCLRWDRMENYGATRLGLEWPFKRLEYVREVCYDL